MLYEVSYFNHKQGDQVVKLFTDKEKMIKFLLFITNKESHDAEVFNKISHIEWQEINPVK